MSANKKPNPVARADTATNTTGRRLATFSACASKPQLTTINGMNRPSVSCRSYSTACVSMSSVLTSAVTSSRYSGIRTARTSTARNSDISGFATTSTIVVNTPSASPFTNDVLTASSGHKPTSCANATLLRHTPAVASRKELLGGFIVVGSGRRGGGIQLVTVLREV